jgi:hypothetical protein
MSEKPSDVQKVAWAVEGVQVAIIFCAIAILIVLVVIANYLGHIAKNTAVVASRTDRLVEVQRATAYKQYPDIALSWPLDDNVDPEELWEPTSPY